MSNQATDKFREVYRSSRRSIARRNVQDDEEVPPEQRYARAIQRNLAKDPELQTYLSNKMQSSRGTNNLASSELDQKVKKMEIEWEYFKPHGETVMEFEQPGVSSEKNKKSVNLFIDAPNLKSSADYANQMKPSEQFAYALNSARSLNSNEDHSSTEISREFGRGDGNYDDQQEGRGASRMNHSVVRSSYYMDDEEAADRQSHRYSSFGQRYRQNYAERRFRNASILIVVATLVGGVMAALVLYSDDLFSDSSNTVEDVNMAQYLALKDLHESTNGEEWTKRFGWLDSDISVCEWYGIACNQDGRVETINLPRNNLVGKLSNKLDSLSHLKVLNLAENKLGGTIPDSLTLLENMEEIYFFSNELTSSIPKHIGKLHHLKVLSLDSNKLSSQIPDSVYDLINLTALDLGTNSFTSSISPNLGKLINLQYLYLDDNMLTSSIPKQIGNLASLNALYLHQNKLTGNVPAELAAVAQLEEVLLYENDLSGAIPNELCMSNRDLLQKLESDCINEVECEVNCCNRCF
jgi:hypothetical protein